MYKVKTLNAISPVYETVLNMGDYAFDAYAENPDAIMVRSANMHEMDIPESVQCVARAEMCIRDRHGRFHVGKALTVHVGAHRRGDLRAHAQIALQGGLAQVEIAVLEAHRLVFLGFVVDVEDVYKRQRQSGRCRRCNPRRSQRARGGRRRRPSAPRRGG